MDLYSPAAKQVIGSNQRTNSFTSLRLVLACHTATSMWPNPLILSRSANNYRGIPSMSIQRSCNHHCRVQQRLLHKVESAALPCEENFRINLSPKRLSTHNLENRPTLENKPTKNHQRSGTVQEEGLANECRHHLCQCISKCTRKGVGTKPGLMTGLWTGKWTQFLT